MAGWFFADENLRSQLQDHFSQAFSQAFSKKKKAVPTILWVSPAAIFSDTDEQYTIRPQSLADYEQLIESLRDRQQVPTHIIYGWSATNNVSSTGLPKTDDFQSLLYFTQSWAKTIDLAQSVSTISVITTEVQEVTGADLLNPSKAKLFRVISGYCTGISWATMPPNRYRVSC